MILDTSAVLAILFAEPDMEHYEKAIAAAAPCRMPVANLLEASIVVESRGGAAGRDQLDFFIEAAEVELVPVTHEQAEAARQAWQRFGKGNHPAALNFGDCFAYALAKTNREPLLYQGRGFRPD